MVQPGSAQVVYNLFVVDDLVETSTIETDQLCCGYSQTAHLSGSTTLNAAGFLVESGDTITIGQAMSAGVSGDALVGWPQQNDGQVSLSVTGCPPSNSCVTIQTLSPEPFPTPVFPLGTILSLLVPLLALAAYFVFTTSKRASSSQLPMHPKI